MKITLNTYSHVTEKSRKKAINIFEIDDLVNAIKYAEKKGATICCISLVTYKKSKKLKETIKKSKMLFTFTAGNFGTNLDEEELYPCSYNYDNTITVASLRPDGEISKSSNYGIKTVDIVAPGTDILIVTKNSRVAYASGTSLAAPYVAKVGALVYSKASNELSAEFIKKEIFKYSVKSKCMLKKVKDERLLKMKYKSF